MVDILEKIGGAGKATDVLKKVTEANPEMDKKTAKSAVRHHLSKMSREGRIDAEGGTRSKGYTYKTKKG